MGSRFAATALRGSDCALLACPACRAPLTSLPGNGPWLDGRLACAGCGIGFAIEHGLPRLCREREVQGSDRLLRAIYDRLPRLHDPITALIEPLHRQRGDAGREGYLRRLELDRLAPATAAPPRLLDVGIGAGLHLDLLRPRLPDDPAAEIWGLDLSRGMLDLCARRVVAHRHAGVRLLLADAHALPLRDRVFDRVLSVGAMGGFRDPARALAELCRVARPRAPIVIVDEQLDPQRRHGLARRALFRAITFYDPSPRHPRHLLPAGVTDVTIEQVTGFYYCLAFRAPA